MIVLYCFKITMAFYEDKIAKIEHNAAQFNAWLCDKSANKLTNGCKFVHISEML